MNNEEARTFIRSYLDFVHKIHDKADDLSPISPLPKDVRKRIYVEFDMNDVKARACRKFGRQQLKKSISLAQEGLLLQSIDKAENAMFLRPDDPKPLVMLMRLYMPKYRNESLKAEFYARHVLQLDPSHQKANELLREPQNSLSKSKYLLGASLAACVAFGGLFLTQSDWVPQVESMFYSTESSIGDEQGGQKNHSNQQGFNKESDFKGTKAEESIVKNPGLPLSIDKGGEGLTILQKRLHPNGAITQAKSLGYR